MSQKKIKEEIAELEATIKMLKEEGEDYSDLQNALDGLKADLEHDKEVIKGMAEKDKSVKKIVQPKGTPKEKVVKEKVAKKPIEKSPKDVDMFAEKQTFLGHKLEKKGDHWEWVIENGESYHIKKNDSGKWAVTYEKTIKEFDTPVECFKYIADHIYKGEAKKYIDQKEKNKENAKEYAKVPDTEKIENTLEKTAETIENRVEEIKDSGKNITEGQGKNYIKQITEMILAIQEGFAEKEERKAFIKQLIAKLQKELNK